MGIKSFLTVGEMGVDEMGTGETGVGKTNVTSVVNSSTLVLSPQIYIALDSSENPYRFVGTCQYINTLIK